ncbi:hypothetical protein KR51_00028420 [Rubidibacter lacunae KORDI 51-2]|uniref:Glycosyltransferase n=1 Tax=Rubidibacter lacunae KORDI 51-2 TaxID=582515 RepID=U5DLK9_9CHRO|nr:glycosyltransferase [Rubidibacter lacunae]ERN40585.1 hypothetical protein KR51_00028420 [Rubidibacter lacunae KORDI 51-2]
MMPGVEPPPVEEVYERFHNVNDAWCVQAYIHLRRRGLNVHLTSRYLPGRICVTSYEHLAIRDAPFNSYVVVVRHDRGRPEICEQRIVQNALNLVDWTDHLMPLWAQPNLKARDVGRGPRMEILGFKGRDRNLAAPFKRPEFLQQLAELGVTLKMSPEEERAHRRDWAEYTNVDAILAIRNCTEYDLAIKPPSKLVNAWFAGCPAILGPEPAFQGLRKSPLDYIEVRSPADVISAVCRLRDRPDLFRAMVENGRLRAREFTPDILSRRWRDLLAGAIAAGYERWQQESRLKKALRPIQFGFRAIAHRRERHLFLRNIRVGKRIFDEP